MNHMIPDHIEHLIIDPCGWSTKDYGDRYINDFIKTLLSDPKYTPYDFERIMSCSKPYTSEEKKALKRGGKLYW